MEGTKSRALDSCTRARLTTTPHTTRAIGTHKLLTAFTQRKICDAGAEWIAQKGETTITAEPGGGGDFPPSPVEP